MTHLAPEVRTTILCLFAALAVASMVSMLLTRLNPDRDFLELRSRIRTWWVIVGLFSLSLVWSPKAAIHVSWFRQLPGPQRVSFDDADTSG